MKLEVGADQGAEKRKGPKTPKADQKFSAVSKLPPKSVISCPVRASGFYWNSIGIQWFLLEFYWDSVVSIGIPLEFSGFYL